MRRISTTLFLAFATLTSTTFSSCSQEENIISDTLQGMIDENNDLISELEDLIDELQNNVKELQEISKKIEECLYITSVTENKENGEENGKIVSYTITFSDGYTITIKVGQDGKDGKDGGTPVIGVQQEDGIYYWTVNGVLLKDGNGNKIPVTATGDDGVTPQLRISDDGYWEVSYDNGKNWVLLKDENGDEVKATGEDGTDGVTPQLKIENGIWMVSYDGKNWESLGIRATGTDGKSFFSGVDPDSNGDYITITLADGSEYKIPTEQGYHKEQVLQIQSLTYLPTSPDGKAEVYKSKSNYLLNLDFIVSPKENASSIIELLNNDSITIKLIATTTTRSDFMTMSLYGTPTLEEDTGILSLTINASDAYDTLSKGGSMAAALSIEITINDVTKTITSDFIALKLAQ